MKLITTILFCFLITACSEDKFSGVSNSELTQKKRHCDTIKKKSPGFAVGCENIRKEIERRKQERKSNRKK